MKTLFKNLSRIISLLVLISFVSVLFTSCGSRKKVTEETNSVMISNQVNENATSKKDFSEAKINTSSVSNETENMKSIEYIGEKGDSLKVIQKGADGKIISETIYTGRGKATFNSTQKTSETTADKIATFTKQAEETAAAKITQDEIKNTASKKASVSKSGVSFYTWLKLFLAIVLVSGLYYLNYRFNLLKRVTRLLFN